MPPTVFLSVTAPRSVGCRNRLASALDRLGYRVTGDEGPEAAETSLRACEFFLGVYGASASAPETAALAERWYAEAAGRGIPPLCYVEGTLPGANSVPPFLARVLREGAVVLGDSPDDDLPRRAALDLSRLEGWRKPAPVAPPPDLVGRGETLAELREALTGRRAVLVGPPGVGKTVLARALACSETHRYPSGVFWAAVGGHADLPGLLATLTRAWALCHPEARVMESPTGADVRRCLADAPGPVLIVFDDVADRDLLRGLVEQLCPPTADILATSRWPDVADLYPDRPWPRVHVQRLRQHDSLRLLRTAARFAVADEHAKPIAQALGGHPLALGLAGSLFARAPSPRAEAQMADDLRGGRKEAPALSGLRLGPHERDEAIEPVLAVVYRRLPEGRRRRFRALGVVPADTPLSPDLLGDLWVPGPADTSEDPIETAFALGNAGLLARPAGPPPGWPQAHALIVAYARALLERESEEDTVVVRYLVSCTLLLAAGRARDDVPAHARQARGLAARLVRRMTGLPDLTAALSMSPPGDDGAAGTTIRSRFTPAEVDALAAVCRLAEAALGANEGGVGDWPPLLAAAAHALGRRDAFAAALAAADRAGLRSPTAAHVPTDPGSPREELSPAAAIRRLAELTHAGWDHYLARRWDQAEAVFREALDLAEKHGSAEGRISVLNNWGELYRSTGRLARAEELLTRAYEEISPDQRAQHPSLLHNLGLLRRAQGDLPRARELLTRAVEGHNASGFDPDSLDTLAALAGVCMDLNELEEAERRLNEGLNRAGQHRLSKAIAEFRSLQGNLARHRGRPLEALPHYQFALEEARARRHPVDEGTARHQIGLAHLEADQLDLAAAAFQAAVGLSRGAGDRPGATLSSALLGSALLKAGRADEAVRWLAPAAEALREIGNRANERTARLDLAAALHQLGRGAESAEALAYGLELTRELHGERAAQVARIQFVAQLREQSPGSEVAPDGPRSHEVLARVMGETRQAGDRHGEAELFLQESLAALQGDDPDGAITSARRAAELAGELGATHLEGAARTNLGEGLRRGGRPEEAVEEFGRAIPLLEAGGNPNSLADAHNNLGLALMEGGRWAEAVPHLEETVRLKRQIGRPGGAAVAERLLAQACQQLEQFAACAEHAQAAAALFRQAGRPECVPELLLTSAAARAELDDPTAAAADLEQAAAAAREIGSAPELATALAMRGVLLGFRLDRPDEGAAALEEAAGLAHDLGLTGEQLGGMTPDGLREAAQRLRTGRASAAFEAGEEAFGRGEWAAAAERFEQALALGHASARIALSAVACSAADLDAASAHLAATLTAHPDDADALYWLGQVSFRRGRYEEGLRAVRQAVAVRQQQGTLAAPEPTKLFTATTGGVMARYYQHREPPRITPDYLALYLARANLAAAFGDHAAALADLAHLLEIQPNRSEYYFLRAQVWVALGRPADAARDLYQATELEPHHRRLYEVRAGIFVGAGDPAGALEDYGWALRLDPDVAATWADRGWALLTLGDFAKAADDFREAAARDPGNAEHPFWAGVALALGGDLSGAVAELDRSPRDAVPDVWRALVALKQQDAGRAAGLLRGWLDRCPDDPVVLFWLGLVERVGSTPTAETYLRRAGERAGAGTDGDQARLRGRLAVLAGDAGGALACCAEVASTCSLLAMRLEVGFLDWLAEWFPASPAAAAAAADLRARLEGRLSSQALQNTMP